MRYQLQCYRGTSGEGDRLDKAPCLPRATNTKTFLLISSEATSGLERPQARDSPKYKITLFFQMTIRYKTEISSSLFTYFIFLKAESLLRMTHVSNLNKQLWQEMATAACFSGKYAESVSGNQINLDSFTLMRQCNTTFTQPVLWVLFHIHWLLWSNLFLSSLLVEAKTL